MESEVNYVGDVPIVLAGVHPKIARGRHNDFPPMDILIVAMACTALPSSAVQHHYSLDRHAH
jgi:hypothetical protein